MSIIYEAIPTLPPRAVTIIAVCVYIMLAGLALWVGAKAVIMAVERISAVYLSIVAAETRLAEIKSRSDIAATNYWIRESYREKDLTRAANRRADQERYNKNQIAQGAAYMERRVSA